VSIARPANPSPEAETARKAKLAEAARRRRAATKASHDRVESLVDLQPVVLGPLPIVAGASAVLHFPLCYAFPGCIGCIGCIHINTAG
jgi:hypothetical protein